MRKILLASVLLAAFGSQTALADWTGKDASGTTITFKNANTCSSVVCVPIAQPVDSTGAAFGVTANPMFVAPGTGQTFPISASALPLPTGAATSALQTTGNTSLSTIATNSGTQATSALQTTGNTSLATIATNSGTQATAANQTAEQAPVAFATATATKSVLGATQFLTTQPTLSTNLQQGSLLASTRGELLVAPGVSGFPVTLASTTITGTVTTTGTVSQATASNLNATVVPSSLAAWGLVASTQNGATPTNGQLAMGQFNTTPTTITSGNVSPFQLDSAGNLLVNVKAGGGSGGTSSSFSTTFPSTGTAAGAEYLSSPPTLTSGQMVALQVTSAGSLHTTVDNTLTAGNTNADAVATGTLNASPVQGYGFVFNGTSWDRMRSATQTGSVAIGSSDPCLGANKTNLAISNNSTSSVQLVALSGSTSIYVCSLSLISASANTVALTTGTGTACATGTAAVVGSTTVANSLSLAANGGLTLGNGAGTVAKGAASSELCMVLGSAAYVSGNITFVQQ